MTNSLSKSKVAALRSTALALVLAAVSVEVQAQTVPPTPSDDAQAVDEIIVTAQRRAQSLQDVPISVAVIGGERMRENAIQTFQDLAPTIPNFSMTKTPAANVIAMRGIAPSPGSPSLEQSVVLFIDGVYGGNAKQFNAPFMDVERVEVLRGPQGALVGKNTSAGAINILSRRPTDNFEGYVNADYNFTFEGPTLEGGVNIPLTEDLAIRAVAKYSDVDGYMYNTVTGRHDGGAQQLVGRLSALYDRGPLTVYAKYEHGDTEIDGNPVQAYSVLRGRLLDHTKESKTLIRPEVDNLKTDNFVLQIDYDFGGHTLSSISGYSGFSSEMYEDSDFTEINGAESEFSQDLKQYSQELRLVSPAGGILEYAFGALYQKGDLDEQRTSGTLIALPTSTYRSFVVTTEDVSLYAQAALNLSEQLRLQGTLRYTETTKSARYRRITGPLSYIDGTGTLSRDFSDSIDENPLDPSVTLQYRPNRNVMLYATYQKGSKSGGFQGAISNAELATFRVGAESSQSTEIGAKLNFRSLGYLNLAAFRTEYEDLQVSTPIAGSTGFFTGNAGDARVVGVELDGLLRLSHGFELEGSAAWNPTAKYLTYPSGPCALGQVSNGILPGSCDMTNVRLPYTPKTSGALTARYRGELPGGFQLTTSVTGTYQSATRKVDAYDPTAIQDTWTKFDARIAISDPTDRWEVALVGRNLTDETTLAYGGAGGLTSVVFAPDARNVVVDPPRAVLLTASMKF